MCGLSMRGMRLRYVPASGGEIPFGVLGRRGEVVSGPASVTPECRYGTRVVQRLLSGSPPLAGPENPLEPAVIALAVPSCKHPLDPNLNRLPCSSIQLSSSSIPILISNHRFGLLSASFRSLVLFDDNLNSFPCGSDSASYIGGPYSVAYCTGTFRGRQPQSFVLENSKAHP
jgi:hypothetical protein